MLIEEAKKRQIELKENLLSMAAECMDEAQLYKMIINLKSLYSNNFRHNYSEFFPLIVKIAKAEDKYSLDYLSNNLETIRKMVEIDYFVGEKEFKGLYFPLTKLIDHINLEIGRYSYYSINEQKISDLEKKNSTLQKELKESTQKLVEAQKNISSVQTELIVVLSIFAAIVLTFSGSISFMGNALNSINKTSSFKTILILLICGFIFANTIFLLLYIVSKVTDKNIYAKCETVDCSCKKDNGRSKCWGLTRIRKRLPYIFWLNVLLLLLVVADVLAWHFNIIYHFIPML